MTTIPHEIIRASAGTGKTFALSDRIIRLLALEVAPETLVALTFTRKAAAEFVSVVFRKLAEAALDEERARELAARLQLGNRTATNFSATLASVVGSMSRLQFGTLDAFFQRIAGTIPFELGLSGPIQILDETGATESRVRALRQLLHASSDEVSRRTLLDAFRAATWGTDEKQLFPRLLGFIDAGHNLFLEAPESDLWGVEKTIWPDGCAWLPPSENMSADAERLFDFAETLDGRFGSAVRKFAEYATTWQPGMELPDDAFAAQLFERLASKEITEPVEIIYYKKPCLIPGKWVPHFQSVVRHYLGASLAQALRAARGIHQLIADYDRLYEGEVRRTGQLAFADVVELLRRVEPAAWQPRLDSRLSHWLFDEFQDTSVVQWSVLANLVDEVLQDPSGERSVFFVGDPKQAIYRWRGGEHRLLHQIAGHYGEAIQVRPLDKSYRSAPAVIDFVNRVGDAVQDCESRLPAAAIAEWRQGWSAHLSAVSATKGFVRIQETKEKEDLFDALLASLHEVDPIGRGLTCAILTRGNDEAAEIAQALRERGFFDIAAETDVSITTDQPMTQALLALISAAAHPADLAARRLVEMSPLSDWVEALGGWMGGREKLLQMLTARGYESSLREILEATAARHSIGRFGRRRVEQLLEIARGYDSASARGPADFVRHAQDATRRETASAGRVQVMTIHKAKGLGFDFVLLPMRTNRRLDAVESDQLLVSRDARHVPEWILGRPPALVIETDPVLGRAREHRRVDAAYESLCVLYVALTRARYGMHLFVGPPSSNEDTLSAADLIRLGAGNVEPDPPAPWIWQQGDAKWFENPLQQRPPPVLVPARANWTRFRPARHKTATLPSRSGNRLRPAKRPSDTAAFGSSVHEAFASIEWIDGTVREWPSHIDPRAARLVEACLSDPAISDLFQPPAPNARLWRERAFDVLLGESWVSGIFDRVILAGVR